MQRDMQERAVNAIYLVFAFRTSEIPHPVRHHERMKKQGPKDGTTSQECTAWL